MEEEPIEEVVSPLYRRGVTWFVAVTPRRLVFLREETFASVRGGIGFFLFYVLLFAGLGGGAAAGTLLGRAAAADAGAVAGVILGPLLGAVGAWWLLGLLSGKKVPPAERLSLATLRGSDLERALAMHRGNFWVDRSDIAGVRLIERRQGRYLEFRGNRTFQFTIFWTREQMDAAALAIEGLLPVALERMNGKLKGENVLS